MPYVIWSGSPQRGLISFRFDGLAPITYSVTTLQYNSYSYRFYPTKKQISLCSSWLGMCCDVYNCALQERKASLVWRRRGWREKHVSYEDQTKSLTEIRTADSKIRAVPVGVLRSALQRVHETDQRMFAAWKAGQKFRARYKPRDQYKSFHSPARKQVLRHEPGARMAQVRLPGAGGWAKIRYHREMVGTPKQITVIKNGDIWRVIVLCEVAEELPSTIEPALVRPEYAIGIDVGLRSLAALSNGELIANQRFYREAQRVLGNRQRAMARKKNGSKSRGRAKELVRRAHSHVAEQRKQRTYKVANDLVGRFDLIAHEDLNIARMVHGNLAKHIYDAAWRKLLTAIAYKAARAGKLVSW